MREEWTVERGSHEDILMAGHTYKLKNAYINRYVIYGERKYGINLRWSKDCHRFDTLKTTASVGITYKIPLAGAGTEPSFGSVSFSGRLITPGGVSDGDTPFQLTDQWEASPLAQFGLASVSIANLRLGTWHVEARTPLWAAVCNVELAAGIYASINLQEFSNGCRRGFEFPSRVDRLVGLKVSEVLEPRSLNLT